MNTQSHKIRVIQNDESSISIGSAEYSPITFTIETQDQNGDIKSSYEISLDSYSLMHIRSHDLHLPEEMDDIPF